MSIAAEIWLTSLREMRRSLRSTKGLAATAFFCMGGGLMGLLMTWARNTALSRAREQSATETIQQSYRVVIEHSYRGNDEAIRYLLQVPPGLTSYFYLSAVFIPILVIALGYDTISGDHQGKTLRYFTPRMRRSSVVLGRALALWMTVSLVSLVPTLIVWTLLITREGNAFADVVGYGFRFWMMSNIYGFSYVGLTVLFSTISSVPTVALFGSMGAGLGLFVFRKLAENDYIPYVISKAHYLLPGTWEYLLLSPVFADYGKAVAAIVAFGGICLGLAAAILEDRDV